jgi:hypothetical protein
MSNDALNNLNVSSINKRQKGAIPFTSTGLVHPIEHCKIVSNSVNTFSYGTAVKLVGEEKGILLIEKSNGNYSLSCTTSNASNSITTASTSGLSVGSLISGAGIPANSVITAISNATTFTINNNATASATVNLTIADVVFGFIPYDFIVDNFNAGEIVPVMKTSGIITLEANGSIPFNSDLMIITTGDKVAVATSGARVIGKNRQSASANGDLIDVELKF